MKMYISKNQVVKQGNVTTDKLVVHGQLIVAGKVKKELPKLKKIHDAHVKKLKGMQPQEPLSKEMPAALPSAQMPPASKPLPQYVVRKTEKHRFSHVVHQVIDLEQENGDIITVFLSDVNQEVRPGSILQNVKIGAHEGKQDAKKIFYTLDEYQIAA